MSWAVMLFRVSCLCCGLPEISSLCPLKRRTFSRRLEVRLRDFPYHQLDYSDNLCLSDMSDNVYTWVSCVKVLFQWTKRF
jgi:hypothetical protein